MVRCANCGSETPAESRYCYSCGNSLPAPEQPSEEPATVAPTPSNDIIRIVTQPRAIAIAIVGLIGLVIVVWAATGLYRVSPGEQATLRRLGQVQDFPIVETGLHWWWPGPIGKMHVVNVSEVRRLEVGFRTSSDPNVADTPVPVEALMITGDLSMVDVQMVVLYNIKNLRAFLFQVNDPGEGVREIPPGQPDGQTLKSAAEAALSLVVGQHTLPQVLSEQRDVLEVNTKERLQQTLDRYQTGINIVSVTLIRTQVPEEVASAFEDVPRARQDQESRINDALEAANSAILQAEADAARLIAQAEESRPAWDLQVQEQADQFAAILREYDTEQDERRRRLYLEALEELHPDVAKFITSLGQEN